MKMIEVEIVSQSLVDIEIEADKEISIDIMSELVPVGEYKHYKGDYSVTPRLESQTLKTENLVMDFDLEIQKIPIERVSNTSGGNTVIIGG